MPYRPAPTLAQRGLAGRHQRAQIHTTKQPGGRTEGLSKHRVKGSGLKVLGPTVQTPAVLLRHYSIASGTADDRLSSDLSVAPAIGQIDLLNPLHQIVFRQIGSFSQERPKGHADQRQPVNPACKSLHFSRCVGDSWRAVGGGQLRLADLSVVLQVSKSDIPKETEKTPCHTPSHRWTDCPPEAASPRGTAEARIAQNTSRTIHGHSPANTSAAGPVIYT